MDITYKLLKHQKGLLQSTSSIAGIYGGRGCGKSYVMSIGIALNLIQNKKILVMAQNYKSLSLNIFAEICKRLDEMKVDYSYNRGSMTISVKKGVCYGFSYENADSCRGLTEIEYLYLDEIALAKPDLFAITAPCLRGNFVPKIRFASSPKIYSYWNSWIRDGIKNNTIDLFTASMTDNKFLSKESIDLSMNAISDEKLRRQEIYGEILDDSDDIGQVFHNSDFKEISLKDNFKYKFGIDASGEGKDKSVITCRKGHKIITIKKFNKLTGEDALTEIERMCIEHSIKYNEVQGIYTDMAYGSAIDEVVSKKYESYLIPFASRPENDMYLNKRAEMYFRMHDYVVDGMYIEDYELKEELLATRYELDNRDKIKLCSKENIKLMIRRSPDTADSLALTFADDDEMISVYDDNEPMSDREYAYHILGNPED